MSLNDSLVSRKSEYLLSQYLRLNCPSAQIRVKLLIFPPKKNRWTDSGYQASRLCGIWHTINGSRRTSQSTEIPNMREKFLFILLLVLVAVVLLYGVWLVLKSIYQLIVDAQSNRELDALARELAQNREIEREAARKRLANGCQHEFTTEPGTLPMGVCRLCGIAREKPLGDCDHCWRILEGIVPESACERCGERFCVAVEFKQRD
jgi:hypothetical protein